MSYKENLESARAYKAPTGKWVLEVVFGDGLKGKLGSKFESLDHIAIEIKSTNLRGFKVDV